MNLEIFKKILRLREFMIFAIILVGVIIISFLSPYFLNTYNIMSLLLAVAINGIIAIGMTVLFTAGDFDLSVGSTLALSGIILAICLKAGIPIIFSIFLSILTGIIVGLINGIIVAHIGINAFITTLGMMKLVRGLVLIITGGNNISNFSESFTVLGQGSILGVQNPIWISIFLIIIFDILLRKVQFFRQNYFIGGNLLAAKFSGIEVKKLRIINFMLTGGLAAVGGVLMTARFGAATVTAGQGLELNVVAAAIIGGASLSGGEGTVIGSFLGAFLMVLIINSLNLMGVDVYWQTFVQGAILLLAVIIDQIGKKNTQVSA